ncbi:MAG: hypothetical protein ACRC2R_19985 [Xenococcaceae cyanobacterium]
MVYVLNVDITSANSSTRIDSILLANLSLSASILKISVYIKLILMVVLVGVLNDNVTST